MSGASGVGSRPSPGILSPLQSDLLRVLFRDDLGGRAFLTGGAALSAYYLGHRRSKDLDLFHIDERGLEESSGRLLSACEHLGAQADALITALGFRRFLVRRGEEATLVDLVWDRAPQLYAKTRQPDGVWTDSLREIAVNKVCTLLSRQEDRDLIDVLFLHRAGLQVPELLDEARRKDGGLTSAMLSLLLRERRIGPLPDLVQPVEREEVRAFASRLADDLADLAWPESEAPARD